MNEFILSNNPLSDRTGLLEFSSVTSTGKIYCIDTSLHQAFYKTKTEYLVNNICPLQVMAKCNIDEALKKVTDQELPISKSVIPVINYDIENSSIIPDNKYIEYVKYLNAVALCSDKQIRNKLLLEIFEVHGVIGVLITNIVRGFYAENDANLLYQYMIEIGLRLPKLNLSSVLNDDIKLKTCLIN